jgi:hypothetical protein
LTIPTSFAARPTDPSIFPREVCPGSRQLRGDMSYTSADVEVVIISVFGGLAPPVIRTPIN